jgi:hypothetical protein
MTFSRSHNLRSRSFLDQISRKAELCSITEDPEALFI